MKELRKYIDVNSLHISENARELTESLIRDITGENRDKLPHVDGVYTALCNASIDGVYEYILDIIFDDFDALEISKEDAFEIMHALYKALNKCARASR